MATLENVACPLIGHKTLLGANVFIQPGVQPFDLEILRPSEFSEWLGCKGTERSTCLL